MNKSHCCQSEDWNSDPQNPHKNRAHAQKAGSWVKRVGKQVKKEGAIQDSFCPPYVCFFMTPSMLASVGSSRPLSSFLPIPALPFHYQCSTSRSSHVFSCYHTPFHAAFLFCLQSPSWFPGLSPQWFLIMAEQSILPPALCKGPFSYVFTSQHFTFSTLAILTGATGSLRVLVCTFLCLGTLSTQIYKYI